MSSKEFDSIGAIPIADQPTAPEEPATAEPAPAPPAAAPAMPRQTSHDQQPLHQPDDDLPPRRRPPRPLYYRLFWPVVAAGILLFLYLLGSQLVFPLAGPRLMAQYLEKKLDRPVTIARAEWRPLAGKLVLQNGIIGPRRSDPYDRVDPILSFRTLVADGGFFHLLRRGSLVRSLTIEQGYAHLVRTAEQNYNFPPPDRPLLSSRLLPGRVEIRHSRLEFSDQGHDPLFKVGLTAISGVLHRQPGSGGGEIKVDLSARGPGESTIRLQASLRPLAERNDAGLELELGRLPLPVLAPYLNGRLGAAIRQGYLDGQVRLTRDGRMVQIDQQFTLTALDLGPAEEGAEGLLLLQALLADREERLRLELPLTINLNRRDHPYLAAVAAFIAELREEAAGAPWALLDREMPDLALAGQISFAAGSAELSRDGGRSLDQLAAALGRRPLLALRLQGISDPACDQDALLAAREKQIREERRRAVTALARELAAGREADRPGAAPAPAEPPPSALLRPTAVSVGREELLALAGRRQEVVRQRLAMALGEEEAQRLLPATAIIATPAGPAAPCRAAVRMEPGHHPGH
jgi:hypothetical protein